MVDFTIKTYSSLLDSLLSNGYDFITFGEYCSQKRSEKYIILRHDVDLRPLNSLRIAEIESGLGIIGSYYFRAVPESWDEIVIKRIAKLGHEVGYHYECLTTTNGNVEAAYNDFCKNLEKLRLLTEVSTICMHGSPRSPFDSKDIWNKFSYRDLGIIGEPYFDTDFSKMFYLTDTGRRWDGYKVSVRDKIEKYQDLWIEKGLVFHSTDDIIQAVLQKTLPERIMITVHPQRWNPMGITWAKEALLQNLKNIVKSYLIKHNK
mgnify:CR=1 FL=1